MSRDRDQGGLVVWSRENPNDFSRFESSDMPEFMRWWEGQATATLSFESLAAFVEGVSNLYLKLIAQGGKLPAWVQTLLDIRTAAQYFYETQPAIATQLQTRLPQILKLEDPNMMAGYEARFAPMTPKEVAEIPYQIRQAFVEGHEFSLQWIKNLSNEAREDIGLILKAEIARNRNPRDAVPFIERILQREAVGSEATPAEISAWLKQASQKTLDKIGWRSRAIALTESARMRNLGILVTLEYEGKDLAYVQPHGGSCPECTRLVEGRVFPIRVLKENLYANFGKKKKDWLPALPQHPFCRHSPTDIPPHFWDTIKGKTVPDTGLLLENFGLSDRAFEAYGLPDLPFDVERERF